MISTHERSQLVNEYRGRPASVMGLLVTCVLGLLLLLVVAMIGIDIHNH